MNTKGQYMDALLYLLVLLWIAALFSFFVLPFNKDIDTITHIVEGAEGKQNGQRLFLLLMEQPIHDESLHIQLSQGALQQQELDTAFDRVFGPGLGYTLDFAGQRFIRQGSTGEITGTFTLDLLRDDVVHEARLTVQ